MIFFPASRRGDGGSHHDQPLGVADVVIDIDLLLVEHLFEVGIDLCFLEIVFREILACPFGVFVAGCDERASIHLCKQSLGTVSADYTPLRPPRYATALP